MYIYQAANISKQQNKTQHTTHHKFPFVFCLNTKSPLQLHRHVPFLRAAGRRHGFGRGRGEGQEQFQGWQRRSRGSRHGIEEVVQATDLKKFGCFFSSFFVFFCWLVGCLFGCWLLMVLFFLFAPYGNFFSVKSVKVCAFLLGGRTFQIQPRSSTKTTSTQVEMIASSNI